MKEGRAERSGNMHKCLRCGKEFERLTEDLLHGCPACGSKLFLYVREHVEREQIEEVNEQSGVESEARVDACVDASAEEEQIVGLRILSPGVYELNLASLLQQKEIILGLNEGSYAIPLTSLFGKKRRERHP